MNPRDYRWTLRDGSIASLAANGADYWYVITSSAKTGFKCLDEEGSWQGYLPPAVTIHEAERRARSWLGDTDQERAANQDPALLAYDLIDQEGDE